MCKICKLCKLVLVLVLITCGSSLATAQQKSGSVTNISFGTYVESHGDDTVNGSMVSIAYKQFFTEQWAYFIGLGSASASGEHEFTDGSSATIDSRRSSLSGGLKWHTYPDSMPWLTPYIGAGLSVQSYSYDYEYAGSEIGKTSGTGYGPLFMAGARMDLARHFLIIPGYRFEQIYIETENGDRVALTSSGFQLALVVRF